MKKEYRKAHEVGLSNLHSLNEKGVARRGVPKWGNGPLEENTKLATGPTICAHGT